MKKVLLFFVFFAIGFLVVLMYVKVKTPSSGSPVAQASPIDNFSIENAPTRTTNGTISSLSGDVSWSSRTATDSAKINQPVELQQGESLETGKTGSVKAQFANYVTVAISPQTHVDFVQTFGDNFVFGQTMGNAQYTVSGSKLSLRLLGLLADVSSGNLSVSVDSDNGTVSILASDPITVAYNDSSDNSQVVNVD